MLGLRCLLSVWLVRCCGVLFEFVCIVVVGCFVISWYFVWIWLFWVGFLLSLLSFWDLGVCDKLCLDLYSLLFRRVCGCLLLPVFCFN